MIDPTAIGRCLREEREKAGLSLAQLASRSGLTKTYLVRLENQAANPSIEVLGRIAEALDLTIADLLGGPVIRYVGDEEGLPTSLRAFAEQAHLSTSDLTMLASIRWREGERPQTVDRWEYVYRSLVMSRQIDKEHGSGNET
jgi:transcriptional regulator with XRE-family HTH domain